MEKIKAIIFSEWFEAALTGAAGFLVLAYGRPLYAGLLLGWATCKAYAWITKE